ncbi:MFS transporter [Paraburkholderia sediminicola]|uniref:MFS transporter n=1 Tax=Paraburkholderia sediminicola TaxID=458836 RepID=UPI0038BA2BC8
MDAKDKQVATPGDPGQKQGSGWLWALLVCFLVIVLDGFNTTSISFVVPKLANDWSLAPARFTPVFVATNIGAAIGFMISGPLAQRFGNRLIGLASVVLFGGSTLVTMFTADVVSLSVLRLIAAIGLGGALPIAITASASIIGSKHKVAASLLVTTGMSVGAVIGGVTGGPLMSAFGWQSIFVVGGVLPFCLVPVFFRILPAEGKASASSAAVRTSNPFKVLFKEGLGLYTCLLWAFSFLIFTDVYALLFWLPTLLPNFGFAPDHASVGMAAFSIGGLGGNILMTVAVAMMTIGGQLRLKSALTLGGVLMILSIVVLSQIAVAPGIALLLIAVIGAGLVNGIMGQTALAVSFYPAQIRATGVGWGHAVGRVGSFVGPAIGGALLSIGWPAREIVLTAVLPAVAAILVLGALALAGRRSACDFGSNAVAEH